MKKGRRRWKERSEKEMNSVVLYDRCRWCEVWRTLEVKEIEVYRTEMPKQLTVLCSQIYWLYLLVMTIAFDAI